MNWIKLFDRKYHKVNYQSDEPYNALMQIHTILKLNLNERDFRRAFGFISKMTDGSDDIEKLTEDEYYEKRSKQQMIFTKLIDFLKEIKLE